MLMNTAVPYTIVSPSPTDSDTGARTFHFKKAFA